MNQFPSTFLWGSATAAYQIEGAVAEGGREPSIWDVFCAEPGRIVNGEDGSVACDHYHRLDADLDLMASLGLPAYRFSVCWPRFLHADGSLNPEGVDFYDRLVDGLLARDITPWLTLYHWDLPASLPGGWTNRNTALRFVDYALKVHEKLGDRVRTWTTLNEPWCSSFLSYAGGAHAPGHTDGREAFTAAHHLMLAHGLAIRALREVDADAQLGITLNFTPCSPATEADADVARRIDGTANRFFADAIFTGAYPADVIEDAGELWPAEAIRDGDLETINAPIDVLGVNYYTTELVRGLDAPAGPSPHPTAPASETVDRGLPRTAMGWDITPDGLENLLKWLHATYTGPAGIGMVITENGSAFDDVVTPEGAIHDEQRVAYLRDHLQACLNALDAGVDLRGYLTWSLMDNFEWAEGYAKRFGIVYIDEELNRIPKDSAAYFSQVIRTGSL